MTNSTKRPAPVSVRFSREERAILESLAGQRPLSAYIKLVLFSGRDVSQHRAPSVGKMDAKALARILAWLGESQIAAHLAVLSNAAESGSLDISEPVTKAILQAAADIHLMRETLMRAVGKRAHATDQDADDDGVIVLPAFLGSARVKFKDQ